MRNVLNWFELPVTSLARATKFYEAILTTQLKHEGGADRPMAILLSEGEGVAGCLVEDPHCKPRADGTLVYLNVNGRLEAVLSRVVGAGGQVLLEKTSVGEPGFIALFLDTEGNRVGLHAERT